MKCQALGREEEGGFQFDQFEGKFQGMHFPDPIIVLVAVGEAQGRSGEVHHE